MCLERKRMLKIAAVTPRNPSSALICAVFHSVKFNLLMVLLSLTLLLVSAYF